MASFPTWSWHEEFQNAIASARASQQEVMADDNVDMADKATAEDWQVVKLRIWARQWRASKLAPKKYGDKLDLNHAGGLNVKIGNEFSGV
jgi:hypothetical protein